MSLTTLVNVIRDTISTRDFQVPKVRIDTTLKIIEASFRAARKVFEETGPIQHSEGLVKALEGHLEVLYRLKLMDKFKAYLKEYLIITDSRPFQYAEFERLGIGVQYNSN